MLLFKRILKIRGLELRRQERRGSRRLAVGPEFPLKAVLICAEHDGSVMPMSMPGGLDWPGQLVDCSAEGALIRIAATAPANRGDFCDLDLRIGDHRLFVPCEITNIRADERGALLGLRLGLMDQPTRAAYLQFVAIIGMGATLKPAVKPKVDGSGYLVETFSGDGSKLKVWREKTGRKRVSAAEFAMQDCAVRLAHDRLPEYLAGNRSATPVKTAEIARLFDWVTLNLTDTVPVDLQAFLRRQAG